jgi:hypothetical protein
MRMDIVLLWEKNFRVVSNIVLFWEHFLDSYCQTSNARPGTRSTLSRRDGIPELLMDYLFIYNFKQQN